MTKRILIFVLLAFSVAACQRASSKSAAPSAKPAAQATASTAAGAPAAGVKPVPDQLPATIARVNGEAIPKDEFERAVKNLEVRAGQPIPPEKKSEVYRGLLDQMIAVKLLLQESKATKVSVSDADVNTRLQAIQGQFPNEQAFTKALGDQHVTIDQLKADQRQQLLVAKLLETEVGSKISITDKDVEGFYAQNPDKFKEPENVHVQHILIRTQPNDDAATKAKAKATAAALLKQVRGGADFGKLAKEKSQDPGSAANGGDLPPFTHGQMVPQFDEAAFKLKPRQVSPVVETQFGYHIIKMVERRDSRTVPLTEAKPRIAEFLKQQQGDQKAQQYVESLKKKSKVEIYI